MKEKINLLITILVVIVFTLLSYHAVQHRDCNLLTVQDRKVQGQFVQVENWTKSVDTRFQQLFSNDQILMSKIIDPNGGVE